MSFPTHWEGWMWTWWVFLALGVVLVVWLIARANRQSREAESAEELLRRRFGAGELDEAEFRERLAALRRGGLRND